MTEELIEVIRQYELLYNPTSKDYKVHVKRAAAWEEVAKKLKTPVDVCKETWKKLRNAYASAIKRRRIKTSGQAEQIIVPWRYEQQMDFLRCHMKSRTTISNITLHTNLSSAPSTPSTFLLANSSPKHSPSLEGSPQTESSNSNMSQPSSNNKSRKTNNDMQKARLREDMDETDYFFLSMSKSLKRLPQIDQAKIKFDLHKAIYDAEIKRIELKSSN